MELVQARVTTARSIQIPHQEELLIVPIGDLQYGSEGCDFDRFERHIAWAAKKPNAYFLGMGDFLDVASPSNRRALKEAALYDSVQDALDELAAHHLAEIERVLAPTKGRWLGFLRGHHFWEFQDGTTSDLRLAQAMGAPFLGDAAILRILFPSRSRQKRPSLAVWCHHGQGSGAFQSSPIQKLEQLSRGWEGIDVFLIGHYHRKAAAKMHRLHPVFADHSNTLRHRTVVLACTGGFLKGYQEGSARGGIPAGTYVEQGMMVPTALGGIVIVCRPRYETGTVDLDVLL